MIKELAIRFFSAFSKPDHLQVREQEREAIIEARKQIQLSCMTLLQKIKEAEKIKPTVMKEVAELSKNNERLMETLLSIPLDVRYWNNFDRIDSPDKKWRVRE